MVYHNNHFPRQTGTVCAVRSTRCLFHKYTTSSPGLSMGAPRSSVASGAGLEPGVPGGYWRRTYEMDI